MTVRAATIVKLRDSFLRSGERSNDVVSPAFEMLTRRGLLEDEEKRAIRRIDPLMEAVYLMAAADGRIVPEEEKALIGFSRGLAGDRVHEDTVAIMLEGYAQASSSQGKDARLEAVARQIATDRTTAEHAFSLVAAVAISDGELAPEEAALLDRLAQWLSLPRDECADLIKRLETL